MIKSKIQFKQTGQNLTLVYQKTARSKPEKYSVKVADKEERDAMLTKIKGYIKKHEITKSELVAEKNSKTLVNLFTKKGTAIRKAKDEEKVIAKANVKLLKSKNKKTVKTVAKKTNALSRIQRDVAKLSDTDRADLLASLGATKQIAEVAKNTPKTPSRKPIGYINGVPEY